ncbi:glutaredoxin family protein [Pantanalinema rosaneae CENA516]|uniref:glutaredoxin family protein n=1 Tax=Pantanalinema rosaneae TaxID=1620701 RepID=UPI003D6FD305
MLRCRLPIVLSTIPKYGTLREGKAEGVEEDRGDEGAGTMTHRLILYSKPGCHLCEGLQEKLEQIQGLDFTLEVRDITSRDDWFQAYQFEIPVLLLEATAPSGGETTVYPIPRPSPRANVKQLEQMLQKYWQNHPTQ